MNDSPTLSLHDAYHGIRSYFTQDGARLAFDGVRCLYKTPDGRKCAVGCLIPDELYEPAFDHRDGPGATQGMPLSAVLSEVWPGLFTSDDGVRVTAFLEAAQNRHDNSGTPEEFVRRLDELAQRYGLEVPS